MPSRPSVSERQTGRCSRPALPHGEGHTWTEGCWAHFNKYLLARPGTSARGATGYYPGKSGPVTPSPPTQEAREGPWRAQEAAETGRKAPWPPGPLAGL